VIDIRKTPQWLGLFLGPLFSAGIVLLSPTDLSAQQIIYQDATRVVWRIDSPDVTRPRQLIPQIVFQPFDEVVVRAGGCAQTGGAGDTWKRYVNPSGGATDRLYHGRIFIPGATAGLVRISSITSPYQPQPLHLIVNKLPPHYDGSPLYLQLGYEDENYGDNGYWGHDDGNFDQCKYENDGGNAWLEITIIHHGASLPTSTPIAPLDLWWTGVDDNFLPMNPTWWFLESNGTPPDANSFCGDFHNEGDALPAGKSSSCTLWDPEVNERGFFSLCGPSSNTVAGHINWATVTYTGRLYFFNFSGSTPFKGDADYNFALIRDDLKGATLPAEPEASFEGKPGLGLEFDTRETVDIMDGTGTWWDTFHHTVDNDENAARNMVSGRPSITIGLVGIDHNKAHPAPHPPAHSESHPVYGLAINVDENADTQKWAIFARNWGDQGGCSQQEEFLALRDNRMRFFIPKPPETTISAGTANFWNNFQNGTYNVQVLDDGILLTANLREPEFGGMFWGDIVLRKDKADLAVTMTGAPNPVVTGSDPNFTQGLTYTATITNNGPDRAHPVTMVDSLPPSTQFVSCRATNGGVCRGSGNNRSVTFPSLAPGASATVTLVVYVDCALNTGDSIINTVTVSSPTLDPNPGNNSATTQTNALDPPPVFTYVPPDVTACTEPNATTCGTVVDPALLGMATATDNCPGVTVTRTGVPPDNYYPVGTTTITYTATDAHGHTTLAYQKVIVKDCTPPVITPLEVDKPVLWPPNHQMQWLAVDYQVTDNCPLPANPCVLSASSNEAISGTGPQDFAPDWQIENAHHLYLRSERAGDDKARTYTVVATCTDAAGNVSTKDIQVVVPVTAPVIEPSKTQQGDTVDNALIKNLPNIARDFTSYVFTLPGVTNSNVPRFQREGFIFGTSGFSIGGSNGRGNEVTVDHGENQDGLGNIRFQLSPEAIREIEVNRNSYPAEFGFTSGGAIDFVTNSGTNNLHGSGYIYYQPKKTSARNAFNFNTSNTSDRQVAPGFTLSGPISSGQAYFFTNYEHLNSDMGQFRSYTNSPQMQPTNSQILLLNRLDTSTDANIRRISTNLRTALTTSQTTYPATFNLLLGNSGTSISRNRLDTWMTRLDYQIDNSDSLTGRFSLSRTNNSGSGLSYADAPSRRNHTQIRDYTTLISWTHEARINVINRFRFQFSPRSSEKAMPLNPTSTSLTITDFANFGRSFETPFNAIQDRFQLDDDLSWIPGNHTVQIGGSYRPVKYEVRNELGFTGDWTFSPGQFPVSLAVPVADRAAFLATAGATALPTLSGLQSFNLNLPSLFRQGFGDPLWKGRAQYLGLFAQDTWKVHPRLILNLGGRIDYNAEPSPLPHHTYFSPRVGFAWDADGHQKTIIRGGAGVFYAPSSYQSAYLTYLLNSNGQYIREILKTPADGSLSPAALWAAGLAIGKLPFAGLTEADLNRLGVLTQADAQGRVIFQANRNYESPYTAQASVSIQRQLTNSLSAEVAYEMYHGVNLPRAVELNYKESLLPNPLGIGFGPYYARVDPNIGQLIDFQSAGNSIYHGMTASLTKRFSNYFQFQANYTLSKTIDDLSRFGLESDAAFPTRLRLDRGLSSLDIRHNFVVSGVFMSPFKGGPAQSLLSRVLANVTLSPLINSIAASPLRCAPVQTLMATRTSMTGRSVLVVIPELVPVLGPLTCDYQRRSASRVTGQLKSCSQLKLKTFSIEPTSLL
jgi:uncharacterized repeat protein (TIGR01451 family)